MKIVFIFLLMFFSKASVLNYGAYQVLEKSDAGKNYYFFVIKKHGKEIAKACIIDPERDYYFFSKKSDPLFFYGNVEKNFFNLSKEKLQKPPLHAFLADFSVKNTDTKISWNLKYLFSYVGVILLAPPYLKDQSIINPEKSSKRFFVELTLKKKNYYGFIVFNEAKTEEAAKIILKNIKIFGNSYRSVAILDYFPLKFITFKDGQVEVIYESHHGHKNYDCLFITAKTKFD